MPSVGNLRIGFLPDKAYTHAPNLQRVAVVSAPVVDKEEKPIAQKLNENVSQALESAKALADKKGFLPGYADFAHLGEGQRDAWTKAYDEYMIWPVRRSWCFDERVLLDRTDGSWGGRGCRWFVNWLGLDAGCGDRAGGPAVSRRCEHGRGSAGEGREWDQKRGRTGGLMGGRGWGRLKAG